MASGESSYGPTCCIKLLKGGRSPVCTYACVVVCPPFKLRTEMKEKMSISLNKYIYIHDHDELLSNEHCAHFCEETNEMWVANDRSL